MGLCPVDTVFFKRIVELPEVPGLDLGNEKSPSDYPYLVFNLTLFPACTRCAAYRLKQIMGTELGETAVELPFFASDDLVNNRFEVVIDAFPAYASEELKSLYMGIKNHLLGFSGIGYAKKIAAIA